MYFLHPCGQTGAVLKESKEIWHRVNWVWFKFHGKVNADLFTNIFIVDNMSLDWNFLLIFDLLYWLMERRYSVGLGGDSEMRRFLLITLMGVPSSIFSS